MRPSLMRRVICLAFTFGILLFGAGCTKKKSALSPTGSSTGWLSAFTTLTTPITNAQSWDLSVYSGIAPSGDIYLSGTAGMKWVILKSSDGGTTWNEAHSHGSTSYGYQVASDSLGNVFAVGATGSSPEYGSIKKYDVGTGLWSTYSFQVETGKLTYLQGVAVDKDDNIYVSGEGKVTMLSPDGWPDSDVTKMIVLKSTDHGSSWNLVDSFNIDDYSWTSGTGILIAGSGDVYAYGQASYSSRQNNVVRKSTDGGVTWTRVYEDFGSSIRGLVEWNGGLILNEDYYDGDVHAVASRVRGTTDTFGHLKILDNFAPETPTWVLTGNMKTDSLGRVYHPVVYTDTDNLTHLVLRGTRGDGVWETLDDYVAPAGESFYSSDVLIGSDGAVYNVAIHYKDTNPTWILRKATASLTETSTASSMSGGSDLISPVPMGAKRIYVTAQTHDGAFGTTPTEAIANADIICNSDSNKPLVDSSATYKALLVNSTRRACSTALCSGGVSENLDWVFAANTDYVTREGIALGTTDASGIFSSFNRALLTTSVDRAWVGLETVDRDWRNEPDGWSCTEWTSADSNDWSTIWSPRGTEYGDIYTQFNWITCETVQRLICVEQ